MPSGCLVSIIRYIAMSEKGDKEYLRISEASRLLGVHANTLRNWDKQGLLVPVRVGRRDERRYERETIMKILGDQAPAKAGE